jgi:hypothetical protein
VLDQVLYVGLDVHQSMTLATVRQSSGGSWPGVAGRCAWWASHAAAPASSSTRAGPMIRRSASAAIHQERRFRAAPWCFAALGAAGGAAGALSAVGPPRCGTFQHPIAAPSARSSHRFRLT